MIKQLAVVALATGLALPALADDASALAKSKRCLACHTVDAKRVGPSYKDVAAKYRSDAGAEKRLVEKVLKGGSGSWGEVPMPPNSHVSEAEAHQLVKWILSL